MTDSTLADLKELRRQADQARQAFVPEWYVCAAFYLGKQWSYWNRGRIDDPSSRRSEANKVWYVDNRIMPAVRTEIAKLTKNRPNWVATPRTADEQDMDAAQMANEILEFEWLELNLSKKLERALEWSRVTGAGFWKIGWDKTLGEGTEILVGQDGSPLPKSNEDQSPVRAADVPPEAIQALESQGVSKRSVNQGDVFVEVRSPFEILPDPLAESLDECEWLIEETVQSKEYVKARYGKDLEADTDASPGLIEGRSFSSTDTGSTYKGVKLTEFWAKPSSKYPQGKRVVWAKEQVLTEEDNPFDAMPYVMFEGIGVPGRFWPSSITKQMQSVQLERNKLKSQIAENRNRFGNPSLLEAKGTNLEYHGLPGERVRWDPVFPESRPGYLQPPEIPSYVVQELEQQEIAFREISGQHEITQGRVPAGVTAAAAINMLVEQDDTRIGPSVTDMENALSKAGQKILSLIAKFYTDERTVKIAGQDGDWRIYAFKGSMLRDTTDVEVQAGSMFPRSQAAKQAQMQEILNLFLQYGIPVSQRALAKYLRDFEVGALENLVEQFNATEAQINRENRQMSQGQAVEINAYDDTDAHIDAHEEWQRGSYYQTLSDEVHRLTDLHVQAHREQKLAQMGPPPQQMPLPLAGGPPDGTQKQNGQPVAGAPVNG